MGIRNLSLPLGVVACGHPHTANAAEEILRAGGNAFDAIIAAQFTACVVEPVLTSLGGGGFLLSHTHDGQDTLYDFFAHTPRQRHHDNIDDFYPIDADFGNTIQEFHIGTGAIATPGIVKGLFHIHRELGSLPITELVAPAILAARNGVELNHLQAYIFSVVKPVYLATPAARAIFASTTRTDELILEGEELLQPQLADTLEALAREGDELFYQGEIARQIQGLCQQHGGHLSMDDLMHYRVIQRKPLAIDYRNSSILTNPAPASGGILIAFALKLLEGISLEPGDSGQLETLELLASTMGLTNKARIEYRMGQQDSDVSSDFLDDEYLAIYRQQIAGRASAPKGTTHISVMDRNGNIASLTSSNGEGCGHILGSTGIMPNNMLGEEDLNPAGFHRWRTDQRMTSMMAPSLVRLDGNDFIALGSGGSNRLRTAILQVLINLLDFSMPLEQAIASPRIHYEQDLLSIETGFDNTVIDKLINKFPHYRQWDSYNLFFGGVHCVMRRNGEYFACGDPRRGGCSKVID
ncbi:MAG: gamma-glutamyltransferase [Gammaproteobacteria bacterium]|nr:MAG: gamma-glutamyltransferase [Gammaproteobacteria bacterium]